MIPQRIKQAVIQTLKSGVPKISGGGSAIAIDDDLDLQSAQSVTNASSIENDDYHETVVTQSGSTGNLDLSAANFFKQTITGNIGFAFLNPSSAPAGNSFTLILQQDSTGGHTITWPASVEWDGGSAPGLTTAAGDKHMVGFVTPDGGTTWIGVVSAEDIG